MAATPIVYEWLMRVALGSLLLSIVAAAAVLATSQPARRIRVIEWTLAGLVLLPCLMLVPGYPRLAVLPAIGGDLDAMVRVPELAADATPEVALDDRSDTGTTCRRGPPHPARDERFASPQADPLPPGERGDETPEPLTDDIVEPGAASIEPVGEPIADLAPTPPSPLAGEGASRSEAGEGAPPRELDEPTDPSPWQFSADMRVWTVWLYVAGVAAMLLWTLVGLVAVRRLLSRAFPADDACRSMLREIAGPAADRVDLLVSPHIAQPCALGWRRSTIVLPESLVTSGDAQAIRWALAHEWSHVARGDLVSWTASGVVRSFYFYQPLVWWLRGQLQLCQDFVADDAAVRAGTSPEDYAEFLTTSSFTRPTLAAGLGIGGRFSDLRRRIIMLVDPRRPLEARSPRRWNLTVLPVVLVLVMVTAGLAQKENRLEAGGGRPEEAEQAEPAEPVAPVALPAEAAPAEPASEVAPQVPVSDVSPPQAPADAVEDLFNGPDPAEESSADPFAEPAADAPAGPAADAAATPPAEAPFGDAPAKRAKKGKPAATPERAKKGRPSNVIPDAVVEDELDKEPIVWQLMHELTNLQIELAKKENGPEPERAGKEIAHLKKTIVALEQQLDECKASLRPKVIERLAAKQLGAAGVPAPTPTPQPYVPPGPRKIAPGDSLTLDVMDNLDSLEMKGLRLLLESGTTLTVDDDGSLSLGSRYGHVSVGGKTLREAEDTIEKLLLAKILDTWAKVDKPQIEEALLKRMLSNMQINVRLQFVRSKPPTSPKVSGPTPYPSKGAALKSQPPTVPKLADDTPVAVESRPTAGRPSLAPEEPPNDRIRPGDDLNIAVNPDVPEAKVRDVTMVEADGSIALGVSHGRVKVGGKTLTEAEAIIQERVAKVIQNPTIQVTMSSRRAVPAHRDSKDTSALIVDLQRHLAGLKVDIRNLEEARSNLEIDKAALARQVVELREQIIKLERAGDKDQRKR